LYAEQGRQDGNGQIRLDLKLKLQDARSGDTLTALAETGPNETYLTWSRVLAGGRLRQALSV